MAEQRWGQRKEWGIWRGEDGEDVDIIDGKDWREAKKIIARCEAENGYDGITSIEIRWLDADGCLNGNYDTVWEKKNVYLMMAKRRLEQRDS